MKRKIQKVRRPWLPLSPSITCVHALHSLDLHLPLHSFKTQIILLKRLILDMPLQLIVQQLLAMLFTTNDIILTIGITIIWSHANFIYQYHHSATRAIIIDRP